MHELISNVIAELMKNKLSKGNIALESQESHVIYLYEVELGHLQLVSFKFLV